MYVCACVYMLCLIVFDKVREKEEGIALISVGRNSGWEAIGTSVCSRQYPHLLPVDIHVYVINMMYIY